MANTTIAQMDLPAWRPMPVAPSNISAGFGFACDLRNNLDADPCFYFITSVTNFFKFFPKTGDWLTIANLSLAGSTNNGASQIFHPTQGPRGTLSTGNSTSKVVLSTAISSVEVNQLANRGDGQGYKIRIIGNASGSSGKTEERYIVANTGGTTPTIWVDTPFTFTPASGDAYEILSGRIYMLSAGSPVAGVWKYYDVATNSFSGNLAITNLPATIQNDTALYAMSEAYVPYNRSPSEGFFGTLTATGSAAGTLTGHSSGGDSGVAANDWRNFQIRIVQDTGTPTAAGQRRRITSHTAGTSPVYTLSSNWTVTPSSTAQYVIEQDDDKILMWGSNAATTYCYNISGNTWDTTTFGAAGGNHAGGTLAAGTWALVPDAGSNIKNGQIYVWRGGNSSSLDVLDIAAGANGVWTAINVPAGATSLTTATTGMHDPVTNGGRYIYINPQGSQRLMRYDLQRRVLEGWGYFPVANTGSTITGVRMALGKAYLADNTKITSINMMVINSSLFYQAWAHN